MAVDSRQSPGEGKPPGRVIGIDPGTRRVGWAVVEKRGNILTLVEAGAISPDAQLPYPERLAAIHTELAKLVERLRPEAAAVESVFVGRNMKSALKTGEGRGVALAALGACGLAVSEYPAREVKRAVTGNGAASKPQVARMVALQLGLDHPPKPEDAADACAVAITHLTRLRL